MYMDVHPANPGAPSRSRKAGCLETAPPGVCFFGYLLCTSKEGNPLARRASGSSASEQSKTKELDSGFRRIDEQKNSARSDAQHEVLCHDLVEADAVGEQ